MTKLFLANVNTKPKDTYQKVPTNENVLVWADSEGEVYNKLWEHYNFYNQEVEINYVNQAIE